MPKQRMAIDVFKDGGLGETGDAIYNHIKDISGKESKIHFYEPGDRNYGSGGGHVPWAEPENVWVDSKKGGAHVLAHELGHSQLKTDLMKDYEDKMMKYGSPYSEEDPYENLDPSKGSTIRYTYEKETVPEMLEEANAQGVAVGTTEALGLGNQEEFYDKPTDYPESFGWQGVNKLNREFSPMFKGAPLGIGITGSPSAREEYYRIQDNIPGRVERAYSKGKSLVQ